MRMFPSSSHLGLALALSLVTTLAVAQMNPMGSGMGGGMGGGHRSRDHGDGNKDAATTNAASDPAQLQFAELEAKLKPNETQWPLWQNFQEKVSALHADLNRASANAGTLAKDDALQQIDRKADVLRNRLAAMEDIADAARALYRALSPEQKKIADAQLAATVPNPYDNFVQPPRRDGNRFGGRDSGAPDGMQSGPPN